MYLRVIEIQSVYIIGCCPGLCRGMVGDAGEHVGCGYEYGFCHDERGSCGYERGSRGFEQGLFRVSKNVL